MNVDLIQSFTRAENSLSGLKVTASNMTSPKLTVEDFSQDGSSYFCERCQKFKLEELLRREVGNVEILTFERGQKIVQDQGCSFCQALDYIYPSLNKRLHTQRSCTLTLVRQKWTHPYAEWLLQKPCPSGSFYISFVPHLEQNDGYLILWNRQSRYFGLGWDKVGYLADRQVIDHDCDSLSLDLLPTSVNFRLLRRWIGECEVKHSWECSAGPLRVEGVKLIDCMSRTIVNQPDKETKYVALSYVWGLSAFSTGVVWRDYPMPLPEDLPATITDAMLVTERLGIQYLWVDRFCIEQDPQDSHGKAIKDRQIVNMHNIYGSAYVTIIAAAGDGPHYGLPGISAKLRHPFRVRIGDRTLEATLADPKALIDASKWSTRAWTYQEGLLSKRRLVFTDQQVYFECSRMGIFEAFEMAQVERQPMKPFSDSPVSPYFRLNIELGPTVSAWHKIMHYSQLDLTNSKDILNGVLGILQKYQDLGDYISQKSTSIRAMRHISGLPLEIHSDTGSLWTATISHSLSWISVRPGKRRSGFPSWSWTGWVDTSFVGPHQAFDWMAWHGPNNCIAVEMDGGMTCGGSELEDKLKTKHDFSKAKILHINAPSLKAELTPRPIKFRVDYNLEGWKREKYHNTDKIGVNYEGAQGSYPLSLTDSSILSSRPEMTGIVLDADLDTLPPKHYIREEAARILLVVRKEKHFERVGVSYIDLTDLELSGKTMGRFLIG